MPTLAEYHDENESMPSYRKIPELFFWTSAPPRPAVKSNLMGLKRLVFHEIGHNWDDELSSFAYFKTLSDWQPWYPNLPPLAGYTAANMNLVGEAEPWVYANSATFAENYGRTNPYEDFATVFEALFAHLAGDTYSGPDISAKFQYVETFAIGADVVQPWFRNPPTMRQAC